jgi:hypothetical protein
LPGGSRGLGDVYKRQVQTVAKDARLASLEANANIIKAVQ